MIRPPPRSTQSRSSAASDVYKRQIWSSGSRTEPAGARVGRPHVGLGSPCAPWRVSWSAARETKGRNGNMPLTGEYEPSTTAWARKQAELYEATNGREGGDLRGRPVIVLTSVGAKT